MNIPSGTHVGLCPHVPTYPETVRGVVLEVTADAGKIVVLLCPACYVQYTVDRGDLSKLVTRRVVTGNRGWDVLVQMEAPS